MKKSLEEKKRISKSTKAYIKEKGHPKGMLGKAHSKESKLIFSEKTKFRWADHASFFNSPAYRQALSDCMTYRQNTPIQNQYSWARSGRYDINGKEMYFRSMWEPNYALYLDFLIKQKQIVKWEYETETFWFEKIRRGVRSYKPDFKVYLKDGSFEYHEVKGYMDAKSQTKMNRMEKYHPHIKMVLIDKDQYKSIKNSVGRMLKFYE